MLNNIGGRVIDVVHDGLLFLWNKAREPTPGRPESQADYRGRKMLADAAKFRAVLEKENMSIQDVQQELDNLESEIEESESRIEHLEGEVEYLENEIETRDNTISELEAQLEEVND